MGKFSGDVYPACPFQLVLDKPSVAYVVGGNINVFGHVLFCFGENVGYIHVDDPYGYPKLIAARDFSRYLDENGKHVFYRHMLTDLSKENEAVKEAERLRAIKWLWLGVPHNCVAFAEQIAGKGGSTWTSKTNLPVFSALGDWMFK